jgi:hypothetical protein
MSGMRRGASLYIVLRIRFGDLGISDILRLQMSFGIPPAMEDIIQT